jgi:hypothetical protein
MCVHIKKFIDRKGRQGREGKSKEGKRIHRPNRQALHSPVNVGSSSFSFASLASFAVNAF